MGDKRNTRKSTKARTQKTPAKSKPVATPSTRSSTRKRKPSVKAATRNKPVRFQLEYGSELEDEGVSQDIIAEDILEELRVNRTPEKNVAARYAPSDNSKNDLQDDDFEEFEEEFDFRSDGDEEEEEEEEEPGPRRIDFTKKKSKTGTRGDVFS
jgi:hypothetical protein